MNSKKRRLLIFDRNRLPDWAVFLVIALVYLIMYAVIGLPPQQTFDNHPEDGVRQER